MERLEKKIIKGHAYYYYSRWEWVEGRCRRVWQKYLGKLEDIARSRECGPQAPLYAEIFECGLSTALWKECCTATVVEAVDQVVPKRDQGLSTGEYIAIAAINRAISPCSKRSMWEWFSGTSLRRHISRAGQEALNSQRFWDHMRKISKKSVMKIWERIIAGVVKREDIDLSSISYDGTNFYTFIDTFNVRCRLAKRGKNKQGRANLRQVSYALFCTADGHLPLFFDTYGGSRNDARQFPLMLKKFTRFIKKLYNEEQAQSLITLIFDKGNNGKNNFALIDTLPIHFVGSVKLGEHRDLAEISNKDPRFIKCSSAELKNTKAFKVDKEVYGKVRTLVVAYNQNLFDAQWRTVQSDINKATSELCVLAQQLNARANGSVKGGVMPTVASVKKKCTHILRREYMQQVIPFEIDTGEKSVPLLSYTLDSKALNKVADTYLGKNILITSRETWTLEQVILAYRSQFIIENVFKEMKDRTTGSWWPLYHWTDRQIRVHSLYCTIALLLRSLILRRVRKAGIKLSIKKLLNQLKDIREVLVAYPKQAQKKNLSIRTTFSKTSAAQQKLISILNLKIHPE